MKEVPTKTQFGNFFRQRRKALGLSLREFCRRNGFDPGNLSRLERGLLPPPRSTEVLESYAKALKLEKGSREWETFVDLAAAATGRIPQQMAEDQAVVAKLPKTFRVWRDQKKGSPWTKATDLELWADYLEARAQLPQLLRRLIHATADSIENIEFPAGEGIQRPGWDGIVEAGEGNAFVPMGLSVWELGVSRDPQKKAEEDFRKRTRSPLGIDPSQTCFIFVTPRKWTRKNEWCDKKRKLGKWKDVRVYDSTNLEEWLETAPGVDVWIARLLGRRPDGVTDIDEHWANLSALTEPSLLPEVFITSREKEVETLKEWLKGPPSSMAFEASSPVEVIDFLAAYISSLKDAERDSIESRILIVEDRNAWHALCTSNNSLILIPRPNLPIEAEMVAEAVRQGHRVLLCSHRFASEYTNKQDLSRVYRHDLEKVLVSSGVAEERASQLAREVGGSLTVLKRRLSRFESTQRPAWSQPPEAVELALLLLAGGWDDANVGDRSIIEKLAGRSYEEVLSMANRWLTSEDAPLIRLLSHWSLVSHEDAWFLLAPHLTGQQLDTFEEVVSEVLGETDPRYDLPPNDRWRAGMLDKLPKYSGQLRTGIAETVALLGTRSDFGLLQDSIEPVRRAGRIVRHVLNDDTTWEKYASLGSLLTILAEAAPQVFLEAVKAHTPRLSPLFADEGDPLFSSCNHSGLLWALETLAWDKSCLTEVSILLARLAQIDPGGRWANRPTNSLQKIFLSRLPQTTAPVEHRIKALTALNRKVPDIGWRLLLDLLPDFHETSDFTQRPYWRDWASGWSQGVTIAEHWQQVDACADLLVERVGTDPGRWLQVIEKFENFPSSAQDCLVSLLREFDLDLLSSDARRQLTEALREKINRHRSFPDAKWSMPSERLDDLEVIKERFEPQELITRYVWLFSLHPRLINDLEDSWEERQEKLFQLRRGALEEILDDTGLQGVFDLVQVAEDPHTVGIALGEAQLGENDSPILPSLLTAEDRKVATFAIGYGQGRFAGAGWEWIDQTALTQWSPEQAGRFLAFVPYFESKIWELVNHLGEDVMRAYWSQVGGFCRNASDADVKHAVSMLLVYDRPFQAVHVLDTALHGQHSVDSSLLMDTLEAGLRSYVEDTSRDAVKNASYEIQQFFECLQADPNVDVQRLASLEWGYLGLLDGHGASPQTLLRLLQTDPKFFADLLGLIFPSDKEQEESTEPPSDERKARARNAYSLLMTWKDDNQSIPGLQGNIVDEQKLLDWVTEVRKLCKESGHLVVCDLQIGEVLARAPEESDGTWPCIPVRDVIDEVESTDLVEGFEIGIFNKRGGVVKSPFAGGGQERGLAQQYSSYAEACEIEWPITAATLRRVAQRYEEDARREDEEAEERALR